MEAPGSSSVDVVAAPGLHFLESSPTWRAVIEPVRLTLTGPDGASRQLVRMRRTD